MLENIPPIFIFNTTQGDYHIGRITQRSEYTVVDSQFTYGLVPCKLRKKGCGYRSAVQ